ncbi:hypothetical protein PMIN06_001292 [Paraphaeosphaeria minitans]
MHQLPISYIYQTISTETFNVEDVTKYAKGRHQLLDATTDATPQPTSRKVIMGPADTDLFEELKQKALSNGRTVSRDQVEHRGQYSTFFVPAGLQNPLDEYKGEWWKHTVVISEHGRHDDAAAAVDVTII